MQNRLFGGIQQGNFGIYNSQSDRNIGSSSNRPNQEDGRDSFKVNPDFYRREYNGRQQPRPQNWQRSNYNPFDWGPPREVPSSSYQQNPLPQQQRIRRPKYMPETKTELELFDQAVHVQQGERFDDLYGIDRNNEIVVTTDDPDEEPGSRQCIENFEDAGLSQQILTNIKFKKYQKPMPIQRIIVPMILKKQKDIIAHAHTGSGKTAAFLLPIVHEIQRIVDINALQRGKQSMQKSPYCIILAPTKELVEQLFNEAKSFAVNTKVSVSRSFGDTPMRTTLMSIEMGCDIFVATCGRLRHHVQAKHINVKNLRYFVLDEGDKLIQDKHFCDSIEEVKNSPEYPQNVRMLLFSATFNTYVQMAAKKYLKPYYYFVRVGALNSTVDTVKQEFVEVLKQDKSNCLLDILKKDAVQINGKKGEKIWKPKYKTVIFVEEKRQSDRVALMLVNDQFSAMSLNGDRTLKQRIETVEGFRKGIYDILVATDVAARGLDIIGVEHVINFDLPEREGSDSDDMYVHRIGRAGRAGNLGLATSFFDPGNQMNINKVDVYIKFLNEKQQEVPAFLRQFAEQNEFYGREECYANGRIHGEQSNAWGKTYQRVDNSAENEQWGNGPRQQDEESENGFPIRNGPSIGKMWNSYNASRNGPPPDARLQHRANTYETVEHNIWKDDEHEEQLPNSNKQRFVGSRPNINGSENVQQQQQSSQFYSSAQRAPLRINYYPPPPPQRREPEAPKLKPNQPLCDADLITSKFADCW